MRRYRSERGFHPHDDPGPVRPHLLLDGGPLGWLAPMSVVHTYPVDDAVEHDIEHFDQCICVPEVRQYGWDEYQIIHNAMDGRE